MEEGEAPLLMTHPDQSFPIDPLYSTFADFQSIIQETLDDLTTTHVEPLRMLRPLNFHHFANAQSTSIQCVLAPGDRESHNAAGSIHCATNVIQITLFYNFYANPNA